MNAKALNQLKSELIDWEQDVAEAIRQELERLSRAVKIAELASNPFVSRVHVYVVRIYLCQGKIVMFDTSFTDTERKSLGSFISDSEIDAWGLLSL